jgi:hypothetical protein
MAFSAPNFGRILRSSTLEGFALPWIWDSGQEFRGSGSPRHAGIPRPEKSDRSDLA